jgi:beta-lactamase superfamily II metal-dependent hydrolase
MPGFMHVKIWDVEHGACAMVQHATPTAGNGVQWGKLAMIDSGRTAEWTPGEYIRRELGRTTLDYLAITNADRDHMDGLRSLDEAGIHVAQLSRNPSYTGAQMREIKRRSGPLGPDAEWYVRACDQFSGPVLEPFDQSMGGITKRQFWNQYGPTFQDTNNLSLAQFISYGSFTILFPGDLEKAGWRALIHRDDFQQALSSVTVLVASHHGRENGFCEEVFRFMRTRAVVISDKPIEHETQQTVPDYRRVIHGNGVLVSTTGATRHVLTTRRDGWIHFKVAEDGSFDVYTENGG